MTKLERITLNVKNNAEISKRLRVESFYSVEQFVNDANRYVKAIKEGRMINSIGKVSSSGMSRTIKFLSCEGSKNRYNYRNYFAFFRILGYSPENKMSHYFRIGGCGMDMIFNTNYNNIRLLHRLGFITKKECDKLAQMTPTTI